MSKRATWIWGTIAAVGGVLGPLGLSAAAKLAYMDGILATTDPAIIAKGKYLVEGPGHCYLCHAPVGADRRLNTKAEVVPAAGGFAFPMGPIGTLHAANLTSDMETGLGKLSDYELARVLRHGIDRNGGTVVPFMAMPNVSDEDLVAIISYLRALDPVARPNPGRQLSPIGWVLMSFVMKPVGPKTEPPKTSPSGPSVARGEYLANNVTNCSGCHTKFDMATFSPSAPLFSGGSSDELPWVPGKIFTPPNLTPDPKTGRITSWSEDDFVARFKSGKPGDPDSFMPWAYYARMTEDDLGSIYRYLKTLPPVDNDTGPSVRPKT